ncbi:MAG: hypothetical protein GY809_13990, partial [Planctomycetes bacterium]|nr:hypothetical protein [Planctomycetota bacterium]
MGIDPSYGPEWNRSNKAARGTPTVDGDHLYLMSGMGCYHEKSGELALVAAPRCLRNREPVQGHPGQGAF